MLRLDFQDCLNQPSLLSSGGGGGNNKYDWISSTISTTSTNHSQIKKFKSSLKESTGLVAYCIAHWTEGNWNYLIVKQQNEINRLLKTNQNYKCIVN